MTQSIRRKKKSVQFADECDNKYHGIDALSVLPEVRAEIWYHPQELKKIKRDALVACRDAQRFGLSGILAEVYGTSRKDTQDRLNYWCLMGSSVRGLERFTNEELNVSRSTFRKHAVTSVVQAQEQLKNEQGLDTANVLRRLSEAYTEQSRIFAEQLGQADEHALTVMDNKAETQVRPSLGVLGDAKRLSDRRLKVLNEHAQKLSDRRLQQASSGSFRKINNALVRSIQ